MWNLTLKLSVFLCNNLSAQLWGRRKADENVRNAIVFLVPTGAVFSKSSPSIKRTKSDHCLDFQMCSVQAAVPTCFTAINLITDIVRCVAWGISALMCYFRAIFIFPSRWESSHLSSPPVNEAGLCLKPFACTRTSPFPSHPPPHMVCCSTTRLCSLPILFLISFPPQNIQKAFQFWSTVSCL